MCDFDRYVRVNNVKYFVIADYDYLEDDYIDVKLTSVYKNEDEDDILPKLDEETVEKIKESVREIIEYELENYEEDTHDY